eukprot:479649_1
MALFESNKFSDLLNKKEEKFRVEFMKACDNFNSDKENISFLIHGYLNSINNMKLYETISTIQNIMNKCVNYCMIFENDKWSSDVKHSTNGHAILSHKQNNIEISEGATKLKVIKYGYGECFAIHRLFNNSQIRKLWKIQINYTPKNESALSFGIGMDNYAKRHQWYVENSVMDKKLIKNGDIITMLFIQTGNEKNLLKFAINGKKYGKTHENVSVASISGHGARLFVSWHRKMEFTIISQ